MWLIGESPGQAHLVLHSQAAVRAHSEARAMLQWDDPLDRRKGSWQSKNMETFIPLQNKITRGFLFERLELHPSLGGNSP